MVADLGYFALLFAFFAAVYSAVAAWYGNRIGKPAWVESARNATIIIFFLVLLCLYGVDHLSSTKRLFVGVCGARRQPRNADLPQGNILVGWSSGIVTFLEPFARRLYSGSHESQVGQAERVDALCDHCGQHDSDLLLGHFPVYRESVCSPR